MEIATLTPRAKRSLPERKASEQITVRVRVGASPLQYRDIPAGTRLKDFASDLLTDTEGLQRVVLNGDYVHDLPLRESEHVLCEGEMVFITARREVRIMDETGTDLVATVDVPIVGLTLLEAISATSKATDVRLLERVARVNSVAIPERRMSGTYVTDSDEEIEFDDP